MKKIAFYVALVAVSASLTAFSTKYVLDKKNADKDMIIGMLYQQQAAEYKALCFQAYNMARLQVDQAVRSGKTNLAIVTDLDETALDNSEGEAYSYQNDIAFDIGQLTKWWLFGKAKAVPGAVEFFQYAKAQGIDIYYISNRPADLAVVNSTRENMRALGFPYTSPGDNSHFRFQTSLPSKEDRRKFVSDTLKKEIILFLGDNLIDINTAFDKVDKKYLSSDERKNLVDNFRNLWGTRYIVFPNTYYGDWEGCLYNNVPMPNLQAKYRVRDSSLKTVDYTGN